MNKKLSVNLMIKVLLSITFSHLALVLVFCSLELSQLCGHAHHKVEAYGWHYIEDVTNYDREFR